MGRKYWAVSSRPVSEQADSFLELSFKSFFRENIPHMRSLPDVIQINF